ncbi:dual specificity protein kinase splA isoform X5 [Drosophila willistoni]|nr:dual specificity protein kinase splA isoform X5 [Drosophila willistoni]
MDKAQEQDTSMVMEESKVEEKQQQQEEEKQQQEKEMEDNDNIVMPNKTDEQKKEEIKEQAKQEKVKLKDCEELEPIYENVSSTISMHEVDNEQTTAIIMTTTAAEATATQAATTTTTTTIAAAAATSTRRSHRKSIPNKSNNNNNENNQSTNQTSNINSNNNNNSNQIDNYNTSASLVEDIEPYYQVPKANNATAAAPEPYYDAPKHLRPVPVYENIEIFYTGLELNQTLPPAGLGVGGVMEPPKEKPPPPPTESPPPIDDDQYDSRQSHLRHQQHNLDDELDGGGHSNTDTWSSDNTYETISNGTRRPLAPTNVGGSAGVGVQLSSPPIKRMNSTKRIKKELRNKRSSFLGIETDGDLDDVESYLELTVAPPPDMAQLLQEERRLEKQLYIKAGLCDSSDTGESRDSGVSENHSRQSSEHYTNSSEENDTHSDTTPPPPLPPPPANVGQLNEVIYQNESLLAAQTPLLQTAKGNSAESWTESATAAAAATQSLSEATATANAKMQSIEEKIREQGEVLRVERELLHFSQEELKRQRENLLLRENIARRELQHGAKMLMSNNRRSLQDLHHGLGIGNGMLSAFQPPSAQMQQQKQQHQQQQQQQQPHLPHPQQIYANVPHANQASRDYRKSMSDLNEFSKRLILAPPTPPTKPMRAMHISSTSNINLHGHGHVLESEYAVSSRQRQNGVNYGGSLVKIASNNNNNNNNGYPVPAYHHQSAQNLSNMSRNTLLALSATPKPKYTDGWVQVQQRNSYDTNLANDPAWLSAQQQKRKSMPDYQAAIYNTSNISNINNNHWLLQEAEQRRIDQLNRRSMPSSNGKPLPDSIIQTLTERVQSKGIGERKRFDSNGNYSQINGNPYQHPQQQQQQPQQQQQQQQQKSSNNQDKVLSVSGKKKCSHCGDELGRGAAMIIESLLLFYHINCFKCCVCLVQLGDGLNGTDVRVRNHKLHCQNCYSSDDGIKFSCV